MIKIEQQMDNIKTIIIISKPKDNTFISLIQLTPEKVNELIKALGGG